MFRLLYLVYFFFEVMWYCGKCSLGPHKRTFNAYEIHILKQDFDEPLIKGALYALSQYPCLVQGLLISFQVFFQMCLGRGQKELNQKSQITLMVFAQGASSCQP